MTNPLLNFTDLPLFDQIKPEHVDSALDILLTNAIAAFNTVTDPSFRQTGTNWLRCSMFRLNSLVGRGVLCHI